MIWTVLVVLAAIGGPALCVWLFRSHLAEDRERRRIQIHDWAMQANREHLKAAAMPTLYKGYRMDHKPAEGPK